MREGFWKSRDEPDLPMPEAREKPWAGQSRFLHQLEIAQRLAHAERYRGWSTCRICGEANGSVTFVLGEWEWPSGLAHYVEEHNVRPSRAFREFIAALEEPPPPRRMLKGRRT